MKSKISQSFLIGLVSALAFVASVSLVEAVLRHFLPQLFEGLGSLVIWPILTLFVMSVGFFSSVTVCLLLLHEWSIRERFWLILSGGTITLVWSFAVLYTFPTINEFVWWVAAPLISGLVFAFEAALFSKLFIYRLILTLLIIFSGIWVAFDQYNSGTRRAQLHGLDNAGYTIYLPANASQYRVTHITPINKQYNGYKDGVVVDFADNNQLLERKVTHRPTANCGEPFIRADTSYSVDKESLEGFNCQQIASKNGVDVYQLERKEIYMNFSSGSYSVSRAYFALAGNTWITNGSSTFYSSDKNFLDQLKEYDNTKDILLDLIPAKDLSPYVTTRL